MVKDSSENNCDVLLLTTEEMPERYKVVELFQMVQVTGTVKLSKEGLVQGIFSKKKDQYQEILNKLRETAPMKADVIIGIRHTTSISQFNNGTFLFITYTGTPAKIEKINKEEIA